MTWDNVFFDGFGGGFLGSLGAFGAAAYVVKRQARDTRALAVAQREEEIALALTQLLTECRVLMYESDGSPGGCWTATRAVMVKLPMAQALGRALSKRITDILSFRRLLVERPELKFDAVAGPTPEQMIGMHSVLKKQINLAISATHAYLMATKRVPKEDDDGNWTEWLDA